MFIVDAHLDFGSLALNWDRDITLPVTEIRRAEKDMNDRPWRGDGTVSLPEARRGRVAIMVSVIFSRLGPPKGGTRRASREITNAIAQGQLAYFRLLAEQGKCRLILNQDDLADHIREWTEWDRLQGDGPTPDPDETPRPGFIVSMECADPILYPAQVESWWRNGLRIIGPAHGGETVYVHGQESAGGLKSGADTLLKNMRSVGMILDLAHLSSQSFWEALDRWDGPVMASHANCRTLVPGERQFDDKQITEIVNRRGVIGMMFGNRMLYHGWTRGESPKDLVTLETVADHIDHICQLAGNTSHVGIGSDLDGGFGRAETPKEIETIADLQKLPETLEHRGYTKEQIENIMHGNWIHFFSHHLPSR